MSHIATVQVVVSDLDALAKAAQMVGLEFKEGQEKYRWYAGKQSPCSHALVQPGRGGMAYEVGIIADKVINGVQTYRLAWDPYEHQIREICGGHAGTKLIDAYGTQVGIKEAQAKGMACTWEWNAAEQCYDVNAVADVKNLAVF